MHKTNSIFEAASSVLFSEAKRTSNYHDIMSKHAVKIEFGDNDVTFYYTLNGVKKKVKWPLALAYQHSNNPLSNFSSYLETAANAAMKK